VKAYGTVRRVESLWVVAAVPHVMARFKRMFQGVDKGQHGALTVHDTPAVARDLLWFLDRYPMEMEDADYRTLQTRAAFHREQVLAVEQLVSKGDTDRVFDLALPPREYQKVAADITLRTGRLLLGDDVGLGKTASAICVATDPAARPMLVVTLTHLPGQWEREFKKFAPGLRVRVIRKGQPYALDRWRGKKVDPPDILIMNYSKLTGWAETLAGQVAGVVFDEAQELRHSDSLRYTAASHIASQAKVRMLATATPIFNYGGEIYNLLAVMAPTEIGTRDEFIREWCIPNAEERKLMIRDPAAFSAWLREEGLMLRRTRRDVGRELPPCQTIPHFIEADLNEIDKVVGDAVALAKIILDTSGRGFDKMRAAEELDWRLRQATGIAKAAYIAEFVRMLVDSGEKVLLYTWHHAVNAILMERLKDLGPVLFTGEQSSAQKAESIRAFREGPAQVLIMSLRAGAGIDGMQSCCRTVVYGELDWSPAVHEQGTGRIYRDGQPDPVVAYFLVAECGSDPVISDVLGIKRQQLDGIRDQKADPLTAQIDPDRIKRLAEAFLHRHQQKEERVAMVERQEAGQQVLGFAGAAAALSPAAE